jgi:hypothetical protein
MTVRSPASEWIHLVQAFPSRAKHRWRFRNWAGIRDGLIEVLTTRLKEARAMNLGDHIVVYNAALFGVFVQQDLYSYARGLLFAGSGWDQTFFARGMAVAIYEAADDIPQILGKQYRESLHALLRSSNLMVELSAITRKFSQFRKEHGKFLEEVRQVIGAHRDHDALRQSEMLERLDVPKLNDLSAEFQETLLALLWFTGRLMPLLADPETLARGFALSNPSKVGQMTAEEIRWANKVMTPEISKAVSDALVSGSIRFFRD